MVDFNFRFGSISASGARNSYEKQRIWQRGEARHRAAMRPLRDDINKVVRKVAKEHHLRHNNVAPNGRIKGLYSHSGGWESHSEIFGEAHVRVSMEDSFHGFMSNGLGEQRLNAGWVAIRDAVVAAFPDRVYEIDDARQRLKVAYDRDYVSFAEKAQAAKEAKAVSA